uniref:Uncharacterized protein n=1 Tax=Arundo donax TaxID=35708 RepID=A0A0A8ZM38_ARUDO
MAAIAPGTAAPSTPGPAADWSRNRAGGGEILKEELDLARKTGGRSGERGLGAQSPRKNLAASSSGFGSA